jgi:HD superfamily phosphodiesterase
MLKRFDLFKNDIIALLSSTLSENLHYHGLHHTLEVSAHAAEIAEVENINNNDRLLLQTAVFLHDAGFMHTYAHHEEKGCEMARSMLPHYGYSPADIELVCGLIDATKIPQAPKTPLQNIIADADLMYLGTNAYNNIAETLYQELMHYTPLASREMWHQIQIQFIENHHYHTAYCINKYEPRKQENLMHLKMSLPL